MPFFVLHHYYTLFFLLHKKYKVPLNCEQFFSLYKKTKHDLLLNEPYFAFFLYHFKTFNKFLTSFLALLRVNVSYENR